MTHTVSYASLWSLLINWHSCQVFRYGVFMREWFLTTELMNVDGLPSTTQGISQKAKRHNWKSRKAGGQGRAMEYHYSNFDEQTLEELRKKYDIPFESNVREIKKITDLGEWLLIDVYDVKAAAGGGCFIDEENKLSSMPIPKEMLQPFGLNEKNSAIIYVQGDSMEPTLSHNDKIVIDIREQLQPVENGVYVIRIDSQTYVKRLNWDIANACYDVVSDNKSHKTFSLDVWGKDKDRLQIIGRVIAPVMKRIY